jgi:hypothetical protein
MATRIKRFADGDIEGLVSDFLAAHKERDEHLASNKNNDAAATASGRNDDDERKRRFLRADTEAGMGNYSKAVKVLCSTAAPADELQTSMQHLQPLHPATGALSASMASAIAAAITTAPSLTLTKESVRWALRTSKRNSSPGPSGCTFEHWRGIVMEDDDALKDFTAFLNVFTSGSLPPGLKTLWGSCNTIALSKAAGGYRPISMGETLRRILGRSASHQCTEDISTYFEPLQLGVGVENGCEKIINTARALLIEHPEFVILACDVKNAFNSMSRDCFMRELMEQEQFRHLLPLVSQFYSSPGQCIVRGARGEYGIISSESGQQQGDPVGNLLFGLGLHPILQSIHSEFSDMGVTIRAYIDDITLIGPEHAVKLAYVRLKEKLEAINLTMSFGTEAKPKTCVWSPSWTGKAAKGALCALPAEIIRCEHGVKVLGAYIGTDAYVQKNTLATIEDELSDDSYATCYNHVAQFATADIFGARSTAMFMLTKCAVPKIGFVLRTTPGHLLSPIETANDRLLRHAFSCISTIDDERELSSSYDRIILPVSRRGCGLRSARATGCAAYLASQHAVAPTVIAALLATKKALSSLLPQSEDAAGPTTQPPSSPTPPPHPPTHDDHFAGLAPSILASIAQARQRIPSTARKASDEPEDMSGFNKMEKMQHKLTRSIEAHMELGIVSKLQQGTSQRDMAHFNSSSGTWLLVAPMRHQRMSDAQFVTRLRRYLNLPINSAVKQLVTSHNGKQADALGDFTLSTVYGATNHHNDMHNNIATVIKNCARAAGLSAECEPPRKLGNTRARPADVCIGAGHGWKVALGSELWLDVTIVSATCNSNVRHAAMQIGGAAGEAVRTKPTKYVNDPRLQSVAVQQCFAREYVQGRGGYYQPIGFECDGFSPKAVNQLFGAWSKLWADSHGYTVNDAALFKQMWANRLAFVHAKGLADCVLGRTRHAFHAMDARAGSKGRRYPDLAEVDLESGRG